MLCQSFRELTIYYEDFDKYLEDLKETYPLKQFEIENIILAVC